MTTFAASIHRISGGNPKLLSLFYCYTFCMHGVFPCYCSLQIHFCLKKTFQKHPFEYEPQHEIFNNVVSATSKASDQPAHTRSLVRAFASGVNIL